MTEQLSADVAIIGGGTAGCSTALHLRGRGATVVLLERGVCGGQASGVNYGGVRQQGRDLAELPLARRSRGMWSRLAEIVGNDCEFVASGHIKLARSDADMAELWATRRLDKATYHDLARFIDPAQFFRCASGAIHPDDVAQYVTHQPSFLDLDYL